MCLLQHNQIDFRLSSYNKPLKILTSLMIDMCYNRIFYFPYLYHRYYMPAYTYRNLSWL